LREVVWQMHTAADVRCTGAHATLSLKDNSGRAYRLYAWVLAPAGVTFGVEPAEQPPPQPPDSKDCGDPDSLPEIRKLVVRLKDLSAPTRLTVVLSPDEERPRHVFEPPPP